MRQCINNQTSCEFCKDREEEVAFLVHGRARVRLEDQPGRGSLRKKFTIWAQDVGACSQIDRNLVKPEHAPGAHGRGGNFQE